MSSKVLDGFDAAMPWSGHAPGGGATALFAAATTSLVLPDGLTRGTRLQLLVEKDAAGHYAERTLTEDLSNFDELRFWVYANRVANGRSGSPFYLRVRLASTVAPFGSPGNTWSRLVPVNRAATWEMVTLNIQDLPAAIRSAVTGLRLECADGSGSFTVTLDALLAVKPQLLADVECALKSALDKQVDLGSGPVAAVVVVPGAAMPAGTAIRVSPTLVEYAPELSTSEERRVDFTDDGYVTRPPLRGYQLYYDIDTDGPNSSDRSVLLDFVLGRVGSGRPLNVNGEFLPIEQVAVAWPPLLPPMRLPLRFRVKAWKPMDAPTQLIRPVREIRLNTEGARA